MALTTYTRSNLLSEWKLVSLSHLTHISLACYICAWKTENNIRCEATKHRAQFDAVSLSFTLSIEQLIESIVTLDVPIIVTRLVLALRKGTSICHIWVNVETCRKTTNFSPKHLHTEVVHSGSGVTRLR